MIRTDRLTLVPLSTFSLPKNDLTATIVSWLNDDDITRYSEARHSEHTIETQMFYWEVAMQSPGSHKYWFIRENDNGGRVIGSITAITDIKNRRTNMGIMIGEKSAHGRGYGQEAWLAVMDEEKMTGTRKIEAGMMSLNVKMKKLAKACGMQAEGVVPEHFLLDGIPIDLLMFGKVL